MLPARGLLPCAKRNAEPKYDRAKVEVVPSHRKHVVMRC